MPCIAACGTGALEWHPRENRRVGLVEVVAELCVVSQGKECAACAAVCREARAIRPGPDALPWVDTVACTGCGSCLGACPSEGALVLRPRQG
ncbi:MAG: 4Fe-4S binding protein [Candidatus Sericytochromatia bacterium]|nr:4Fe-4S binding protein [Candidatus Sericytochromatia bacterium]